MNEEQKPAEGYAFSYVDCTGKKYLFKVEQETTTWPELLDDFLNFISGAYGYDIKKSVRIEAPRCYNSELECAWKGEYFDKDEEINW